MIINWFSWVIGSLWKWMLSAAQDIDPTSRNAWYCIPYGQKIWPFSVLWGSCREENIYSAIKLFHLTNRDEVWLWQKSSLNVLWSFVVDSGKAGSINCKISTGWLRNWALMVTSFCGIVYHKVKCEFWVANDRCIRNSIGLWLYIVLFGMDDL